MTRRLSLWALLMVILHAYGCIKETYDMRLLQKEIHLSPSVVISVMKGDISLSDIIKPNDTIIFDQDNFVRIVIKEDSLFDLKMEEFYDLSDMVSFTKSYIMGDMSIDPFYKTIDISLGQISTLFPPSVRNQFILLDNTTNIFPPFPSTPPGEYSFSPISNIDYAHFSSGMIEISVKNNLPAPISGLTVQLYNNDSGNTPIGPQQIINPILPGAVGLATIDLANISIISSISASVTLGGSPGTAPSPVLIDLEGSGIEISIMGRDMKVKSGRVILPSNYLTDLVNTESVTLDPGNGVELDELKITSGNLSYHIQKPSTLNASLTISMPTVSRNDIPVLEMIDFGYGPEVSGNISFDNTLADLGTLSATPYNQIPYSMSVSTTGMVDFNSTDIISLDFRLLNPVFDYAKGYFGKQIGKIDADSTDLDIKDILDHISGDLRISNPSIKLNYSNSFAIPIEVELNARGIKGSDIIELELDPFDISYPTVPQSLDIQDTYIINKDNSSLPDLLSMPPEVISYSGTAIMNPAGNTGERDNYIFGDSRFAGSLEIEVPLELQMKNLEFADTTDNFLKNDSNDENDISPEDFKMLRIDITAKNGFPLEAALKLSLYNSQSNVIKNTVEAGAFLEAAPVDSNGKASGVAESSTRIELTSDFFNSVNMADKIIFRFTFNTTGSGSKEVKIYSDYKLEFRAALVFKAEKNFLMK